MNFTKDICFDKEKIYENSELTVTYNGFLSNENSDKLYISYGYGSNWDRKNEIELSKTENGYVGSLQVESGNEIQFCLHDSQNNWDNNNQQNYIIPIYAQENQEVENTQETVEKKEAPEDLLKFEPIVESQKELNIDVEKNTVSSFSTAPFKPVTVSSEIIDIYTGTKLEEQNIIIPKEINLQNCKKLDDIKDNIIPNQTVVTKVNLNSSANNEEKTFDQKVISFNSLKGKKENFNKAFDENSITAGSVYVSSLIKDYQQKIAKEPKSKEPPKFIEDITINTKSLVPVEEKSIAQKGLSKIYLLKKKIKLSISKFIKLIKTALNYNEDRM